jgi:hypothetical protein
MKLPEIMVPAKDEIPATVSIEHLPALLIKPSILPCVSMIFCTPS